MISYYYFYYSILSMGTRLTDSISNSRLYEIGSIPLSRAIMKERLRWLGHVLRMKDDRLPKIVLFGQLSGATGKAGCPRLGWENVLNKDLKEMGTSWEGVKSKALNRGACLAVFASRGLVLQ